MNPLLIENYGIVDEVTNSKTANFFFENTIAKPVDIVCSSVIQLLIDKNISPYNNPPKLYIQADNLMSEVKNYITIGLFH